MNQSFSNEFGFFQIFRIFQNVFRPCSRLYFEPRKIHNIVLYIKKITKKIRVVPTLFVAAVRSCCSMIVVIIIADCGKYHRAFDKIRFQFKILFLNFFRKFLFGNVGKHIVVIIRTKHWTLSSEKSRKNDFEF